MSRPIVGGLPSGDFLRDFADGLRQGLPPKERRGSKPASSLIAFLEDHVPTDTGRYSLEGHEPLREILQLAEHLVLTQESDSRIDIVKAEQLGVSTAALGFALWAVAEQGYNVGYFLPNDDLASEFGMARLNPIIDESSHLTWLMEDATVDRGVLKQIGEKLLYLLGLHKISGATTRPMDLQVSDEVDLTSERIRRWKRGRMRHSKLRVEVDFSAPYRQDSGIDKRYQEGSQRRWLVKCVACGKVDICLEELMDLTECMRNFSGTWVRVCPKCHRKLDVTANGQWVAAYPDREKEGRYSFRLSAFAVEAIDAAGIMKSYLDAENDAEAMPIFDRTVRGIPNAGALQPITDAVLRKMERDYVLITDRRAHPIFFGVDCGNACWFWAEEWLPEGRPRLVWAEKMHSDRWVERTRELIAKLQPRFGVIDRAPLLTDSRKLAYAFPHLVALQGFENGKDLELSEERIAVEDTIGAAHIETGPKYWAVRIDRNLALAQFCAEAVHPDHGLIIPKEQSKTMALVRSHLKKLQKEADTDAKGNEIHRFMEKVENHFGMAAASARLARLIAPNIQPFAHTPLPISNRRAELAPLTGESGRYRPGQSRRSRLGGMP